MTSKGDEKMTLAIMQPYLFPYVGYFQLIHAADKFVICDDVQYIKRGWINRNRILINGRPHYFTLSVKRDARSLSIKERFFSSNNTMDKGVFLKMMNAYRKAPYYAEVTELLRGIMSLAELNVAAFVAHSIREVCRYLSIKTPIVLASEIEKDQCLRNWHRIVALCRYFHADHYINPVGGMTLYSKEKFAEQGIILQFLKTKNIEYPQFKNKFHPNLSIIDVMMFNSKEKIQAFLNEFELL